MPSNTPSRHPQVIPRNARKELLKSNIRSMMEKASIDRMEERRSIEEDLKRISSIEVIDPEMEKIEREKRIEIKKARETLLEVEEDIDEEFEKILSSI
jgi:hypothetical protein